MTCKLLLAAVLCLSASSSAFALTTLEAAPYTFTIADSGGLLGSIAGLGGVDIVNGDMGNSITGEVTFVDGDTIDILARGPFAGTDVVFNLSGLHFLVDGVSTSIRGVKFNRAGSNIDEFIGDIGQPDDFFFVEPILASTATSFAANFQYYDLTLAGDPVRLRYDLQLSAVPLPTALPFLLTGLFGLVGVRLRKKRATQA